MFPCVTLAPIQLQARGLAPSLTPTPTPTSFCSKAIAERRAKEAKAAERKARDDLQHAFFKRKPKTGDEDAEKKYADFLLRQEAAMRRQEEFRVDGQAAAEFALRSRSECPQCGAAQSFADWRNGVKRCQKDACKGAVLRPAKVWGMVQESFLTRWAEFNIKREKNLAKLDAETMPPFRVTHRVKYLKVRRVGRGSGGGRFAALPACTALTCPPPSLPPCRALEKLRSPLLCRTGSTLRRASSNALQLLRSASRRAWPRRRQKQRRPPPRLLFKRSKRARTNSRNRCPRSTNGKQQRLRGATSPLRSALRCTATDSSTGTWAFPPIFP